MQHIFRKKNEKVFAERTQLFRQIPCNHSIKSIHLPGYSFKLCDIFIFYSS